MARVPKPLKAVYNDLRPMEILGQAHKDEKPKWIELCSSLREDGRGHEHLATIVHETIHIAAPFLTEETVLELEKRIAAQLWGMGYRKTQP